jgi:hypothetical protein
LVELKPKIELKIAGYCSKNKPFRITIYRDVIWTKNRIALDHVYIERRLGLKIDPGSPGTDLKINNHWTKNRMGSWTKNSGEMEAISSKNNDAYRLRLRTSTWRDIYVIQAQGNI